MIIFSYSVTSIYSKLCVTIFLGFSFTSYFRYKLLPSKRIILYSVEFHPQEEWPSALDRNAGIIIFSGILISCFHVMQFALISTMQIDLRERVFAAICANELFILVKAATNPLLLLVANYSK